MKAYFVRLPLLALSLMMTGAIWASAMDRPIGVRIGQRMTLKPYVALSVSYDSNVESRKDGMEDIVWLINPGLTLEYKADSWMVFGNIWYQYNGYAKQQTTSTLSYHSFGEDLTYRWTDSLPGEKGWSVMLSEKFQQLNQLENVIDSIGHEYGRDRQEFKFAGAVQRRVSNRLHADINANYYWLKYDNDNNQDVSYGLYGWNRWGVGGEIGYAFSPWTDLLIAGSYQQYEQENRENNYYQSWHKEYGMANSSKGWTVQAGLGSFATEKLTYRLLGGLSTYEYDEGGANSSGFSYTAAANWRISETWKTMLLATSYYQPTEREFGSSQRVDSLSWGVTHSMVQGKLHGMFDIAYRREGREYSAVSTYDYDLDIITARLGLTYILNRYLQLYTNVEYRKSICEDDDSVRGDYYDYDRFRLTLGLRFTY